MRPEAIATFAVIALFVWGGLILIVATALRREGAKARAARSETTAPRA